MMSHEDERRLAAIERQMLDDDPEFVRRFRDSTASSMPAQRAARATVTSVHLVLCSVAAFGGLIAVTGVLAISPALVLIGGSLVAGAAWWFRRMRRHNAG